ncbi:MAG: type II toxin-antitoxin system PemK/MazF family toxin [Desulfamplus sp.]|nr:type II toxin-antitoxin system PemK/MazF family toxin [Desulfamplus sp.]
MTRGDVILIRLPSSNGREQSGYRPAIVVQKDMTEEPMLMIVPVTSNLSASRFAFSVRIEPSMENGVTLPSVAMVFQMRAIDKNRIMRKIGSLLKSDMTRIDEEIWRMLEPSYI